MPPPSRAAPRMVPGHGVANHQRHRHGQPAGEAVPVHERTVRRRAGAHRFPGPVQQRAEPSRAARRRARSAPNPSQATPRTDHADAAARERSRGRTRRCPGRRRRAPAPTPSIRRPPTADASDGPRARRRARSTRSTVNASGESRSRDRRAERNQLRGDRQQAEQQRPVEHAAGAAADRRTREDQQQQRAGAQRDRRPAVRAGKGYERPADEEKEEEGRRRNIRASIRRSSSCTDGRSTASSSTCSSRS